MFFKKKFKVVTHDGSFHADDVFAVAVIQMAFPNENIEVMRTRNKEIINSADIAVDIGGEYSVERDRYDHHQIGGAGRRENQIPYASFGLVWKKFGAQLCESKEGSKRIDDRLVSVVDAEDNGIDIFENKYSVKNFSVYEVIASFNKTTLEKNKTDDQMFKIAVNFAIEILKREIASTKEFFYGKKIIEDSYNKSSDKQMVVLEESVDKSVIYDVLQNKETLYVVYPYHKVGWAVRAMRISAYSFKNKKDLPKEWAGKRDKDLQEVTGVSDAIFCHSGRYIANAKSKEGAIKLAELAVRS